jgi:hypothetical protein
MKEEEKGGGKKLHNDKLYNLYSSPYFITVFKSRRMQ